MPDISMCLNMECKQRNDCYRYLAIPDTYWQSYAYFNSEGKKKCSNFWDKKDKRIRTLEEADAFIELVRRENNLDQKDDVH